MVLTVRNPGVIRLDCFYMPKAELEPTLASAVPTIVMALKFVSKLKA
jgi:hypothetical protein